MGHSSSISIALTCSFRDSDISHLRGRTVNLVEADGPPPLCSEMGCGIHTPGSPPSPRGWDSLAGPGPVADSVFPRHPMKALHRPDLYCWSSFDEGKNVDFNGYLWVRPEGNIAIDPMPLTAHDLAHIDALGGVSWVVMSNSDHIRGAEALAAHTGAQLAGPAGERDTFPIACARWLADGEELVPGLVTYALQGSKTPEELAFLLDGTTAHHGRPGARPPRRLAHDAARRQAHRPRPGGGQRAPPGCVAERRGGAGGRWMAAVPWRCRAPRRARSGQFAALRLTSKRKSSSG